MHLIFLYHYCIYTKIYETVTLIMLSMRKNNQVSANLEHEAIEPN